MPTPAEQARRQNQAVLQQTDLIESALEEHIQRGATKVTLMEYQGMGLGGFRLGTGFLPRGTTWPALVAAKTRYENAGWDVHINNSQRDGMFIRIDAGEAT